jgi:type II secretory pathway pseudopilin PulG
MINPLARAHSRAGITLTEILIAIMILAIGLVSLATLFPLGLLRLRDAARYSRSAFLVESVAADAAARGLFNKQGFYLADSLNTGFYPFWYTTPVSGSLPNQYDPFTQDTPSYGGNIYDTTTTPPTLIGAQATKGIGLPFAYDPLWRYQTGTYLDPLNTLSQSIPEARFGSGIGFIRPDPSDAGNPSAYGLQRLTNFNRPTGTTSTGTTVALMPSATQIPSIFVSPEDVVWQESTNQNYLMAGNTIAGSGTQGVGSAPSPVVPDLSITPFQPVSDWHYSWMFTGLQTNTPIQDVSSSLGATFDGNIVIFENRPFSIDTAIGPFGATTQIAGETVVEAVFGYSGNVLVANNYTNGYGAGADRTVLLRWPGTVPDPVVKVGDWIADVTYERNQQTVLTRFFNGNTAALAGTGTPNMTNNLEWDDLPAQRCFWYRVQKIVPPTDVVSGKPFDFDGGKNGAYRYMVVYVDSTLQARTLLSSGGAPAVLNAALISPYVVNVIPQTVTSRSTTTSQ